MDTRWEALSGQATGRHAQRRHDARPWLSGARPFLHWADERIGAALRELAFRPYAAVIALTVLCCLLFLPGIATLPVTDRDEARFAQASRQMLETGNYIDIRFQEAPRYKKPIGIYWLQAASAAIAAKAGAALDDIWAYRIPSFLSALGAVLLIFWAARSIMGRKPALVAAALFASTLGLVFEAHIAKSDAALIGSIALMQGALFRLYMAPRGTPTFGLAMLFWLGMGAGVLIKGPVPPALAIFTSAGTLALNRDRAWLGNLHWRWGLPLLLAVTLPWFVAIGISSGGAFFKSSLGQDFAAKLQGGQESHWAPPGTYLILFFWTFWPATLFVSPAVAKSLYRLRHSRRAIFLLSWILPFWLLIEAVPTKLPHYALPLYPAIALAAAFALHIATRGGDRKFTLAAIVWTVIAALQLAFIAGVCWLFEAKAGFALFLLLGIFALCSAVAATAAWRAKLNVMLAAALIGAVAFYAAAFRFALPALEPIWISEKAAAARHALQACGRGPAIFAGFSEPSIVFRNGTGTILTSPVAAADKLANAGTSLAFVAWPHAEDFARRFAEIAGKTPIFLGCVDGVDINGRGPTRLNLYAHPGKQSITGCAPIPETRCLAKASARWRGLLKSKF